MPPAHPLLRAVLAGVCGIAGTVLAVAWGYALTIAPLARDWIMFPTTLPFLRRSPVSGDVTDFGLDALKVVLVLASVALVAMRARASMLRGLQVAIVMLLANASVQLLKYWPGQERDFMTGLEPLSGHAALVGAVTLAWLVTRGSTMRQGAAAIALAAVTLTGLAAVVPGRHSPIQVACPLVICLGWGLALLVIQPRHTNLLERRQYPLGAGLAAVGFLLVLVSVAPPGWWPAVLGAPETGARLVLVAAFVAGSASLVVGATVLCASALAGHSDADSSADPLPARGASY